VHLGPGAHVACHGKGRKDRITPLTSGTIAALRDWLSEQDSEPDATLFPTRRGSKLSRDAIEHRLAHYTVQATDRCPSLHGKTITAHVLRHTTAMRLLHAGVDTSVIALWRGHVSGDTTQIYIHADLRLKEQALARTRPPNARSRTSSVAARCSADCSAGLLRRHVIQCRGHHGTFPAEHRSACQCRKQP
jgi:integrase/recombinase XerD